MLDLYSICTKCKKNKPLVAFYKDKRLNDGVTCRCKQCLKEDGNIPSVKKRKKKWQYEWYRNGGKEVVLSRQRERRYGISEADYQSLLLSQKGVCAICSNPEKSVFKGNVKLMAVDHDHESGKIRGLLCSSCNTAIGLMGDNIELMAIAIAYIEHHKNVNKEVKLKIS